jgi:hypothetical protein
LSNIIASGHTSGFLDWQQRKNKQKTGKTIRIPAITPKICPALSYKAMKFLAHQIINKSTPTTMKLSRNNQTKDQTSLFSVIRKRGFRLLGKYFASSAVTGMNSRARKVAPSR